MTSHGDASNGGPVSIAPIPRSTVRDAVRDALRDLIISGGVEIGVPLRQDELAARLQVSRTPLREALHGLASEGLVTIDPRRGAMVTKPTVRQLLDLYEIREQLEVYAGRKVVALAEAGEIDHLDEINNRMAEVDDPVEWAHLNQQFHSAVFAPCPNVELVTLIEALAARAKFYVRILVSSRRPALDAVHEHQAILGALRAKDPDAMGAAIRRHLRSTVEHVAPTLTE